MKQEDANILFHKMSPVLDNSQMLRVQSALDETVSDSEASVPSKASSGILESILRPRGCQYLLKVILEGRYFQ